MKKKKRNFDARFWSGQKKHSPKSVIEVFFRFYDLATAKERLSLIVHYAAQKKTRIPEDPSSVFHFYQSMRSVILAEYCLRKKTGKWAVEELLEDNSPLGRGSLSEDEYRDPVRVFEKAFQEYRPEEFMEFLAETVHFSLGSFKNIPDARIFSPYLHLVKMLEAAWLIVSRTSGGEL